MTLPDRRLTTIYITHGHANHFLGLPVLLDRFPDARPVATATTVKRMRSDCLAWSRLSMDGCERTAHAGE